MLKKITRWLAYSLYLFLTVFILLEISYRFYVVDFYRTELQGLNATKALENVENRPVILAMGDSFTAEPRSYVQSLRVAFPEQVVINSGVPGTCVREAKLMTSRRMQQFNPKVLIYQIYVGNDLLEFRHPTDSPVLSKTRRLYWWLSDRVHVLGYLNFRFRFLSRNIQTDFPQNTSPQQVEKFAPQTYSERTKMHFRAEPLLIENEVALKNGRDLDMVKYLADFENLLAQVCADCQVIVLVIPHCMQVSKLYEERMLAIGAQVTAGENMQQVNYPFYQALQKSIKRERTYLLNALPVLQEATARENLYYENDPHLNPRGQQVIGQYLVDFMEKENIVEKN